MSDDEEDAKENPAQRNAATGNRTLSVFFEDKLALFTVVFVLASSAVLTAFAFILRLHSQPVSKIKLPSCR
jgi:hypothetical protein